MNSHSLGIIWFKSSFFPPQYPATKESIRKQSCSRAGPSREMKRSERRRDPTWCGSLVMFFPPQHFQLEVSLEHELFHRVAGLLDGQPVLQHLKTDSDSVLPGFLVSFLLLALLLLLLLVLGRLDRLVPQSAHLPLLSLLGSLVTLEKWDVKLNTAMWKQNTWSRFLWCCSAYFCT